jgi:hypothetical protein
MRNDTDGSLFRDRKVQPSTLSWPDTVWRSDDLTLQLGLKILERETSWS